MLTQEQQDIVWILISTLVRDVESPEADVETLIERTEQTLELAKEAA